MPPIPRTAWAELDLDALTANLEAIRALAGTGVPVNPVVKADAYGHGAVPIAMVLADAGAEGLCVATLDEAVALRSAGLALPILVLYPVPSALAADARRLGIAVTASDPVLLGQVVRAAADGNPGLHDAEPLAVELEVETGLGRGGFAVEDVVVAARAIDGMPGLALAGLWTHLQAAEDADRTRAQVRRFEEAAGALERAGVALPPRHVAASGGLLTDGVLALDGVRPGLAVYGLVPDELLEAGRTLTGGGRARLRAVLSLHARPVRVLDLPAGWGISYGPTFTTTRCRR